MNLEELTAILEEKGLDVRVQSITAGVRNRVQRHTLWVPVERERLKEVVAHLIDRTDHFPHFSVISPSDQGDQVELNYHFTVNYGAPQGEMAITFKVTVSKEDCWVPTLTDLVPGTAFSEREIREMMGVDVHGLEDTRHLFLTEGFPEGVYPWRRDDTAPQETNKLYEGWKE